MNISIMLPSNLLGWANRQSDLQAAILEVLQAHVASSSTAIDLAEAALKERTSQLPVGMEFEIPQILGREIWSTLSRSEIVRFGKKVKADPAAFGLEFIRTTVSRHAVYKKLE